MSAFHRVDDVGTMPAQRFINFAIRLAGYKGIVRALAEAEANADSGGGHPAPAAPAARQAPASRDVRQNRTVPSDATTLLSDPAFAGLIEPAKGAPDA